MHIWVFVFFTAYRIFFIPTPTKESNKLASIYEIDMFSNPNVSIRHFWRPWNMTYILKFPKWVHLPVALCSFAFHVVTITVGNVASAQEVEQ